MPTNCNVAKCTGRRIARGLCNMHYKRFAKNGTTDRSSRSRPKPASERFLNHFTKQDGDTCWEWSGTINSEGYGVISEKPAGRYRQHKAHRLSYEHFVGSIPDGLGIDHQCRNRSCVNPAHLFPATTKQNGENRASLDDASSQYRGVHFSSARGKWKVTVRHQGRSHHGGYFADEQDAADAARALRNTLFTNNPADRVA